MQYILTALTSFDIKKIKTIEDIEIAFKNGDLLYRRDNYMELNYKKMTQDTKEYFNEKFSALKNGNFKIMRKKNKVEIRIYARDEEGIKYCDKKAVFITEEINVEKICKENPNWLPLPDYTMWGASSDKRICRRRFNC